jgi:hypothetical protein
MSPAPLSSDEDDSVPERRVTPPPAKSPLEYLGQDSDDDDNDTSDDDEPVERRKQAEQDTQSDMVRVKKRKKRQDVAPRQKARTDVPPLKLTCEIVLSPAVLDQIARHVETLFLEKMQKIVD